MADLVIETLIQKVANMLSEIAEINLLIRRLSPAQESLNRLYERVDATHGILKVLEKGVSLDEAKLMQLEEQTIALRDGLHARDEETHHVGLSVARVQQLVEWELQEVREVAGMRKQLETISEKVIKTGSTIETIKSELHSHRSTQYVIIFLLIMSLLLTVLRR